MISIAFFIIKLEKLTILGCGSALPSSRRNPTAQILEHNGKYFLIDCGEGTQSRLRENKLSFDKISHIFISHLHGDHYLGLPGLISSMQLLGRTRPLKLFGPPGIWEILTLQFKLSKTFIKFSFEFFPVFQEVELFSLKDLNCRSIELNHRIDCFGFVFTEKEKPRRINGSMTKEFNVPHYFMNNLRLGEDFTFDDGVIIENKKLTFDPKKSHSYAFCGDNRVKKDFYKKLIGVTVVYHESTFLHSDLARAKKTFHTTALEAAKLADKVKPDLLIIGHYSARYNDSNPFLLEAKEVFKNTIAGEESSVIDFSKI